MEIAEWPAVAANAVRKYESARPHSVARCSTVRALESRRGVGGVGPAGFAHSSRRVHESMPAG